MKKLINASILLTLNAVMVLFLNSVNISKIYAKTDIDVSYLKYWNNRSDLTQVKLLYGILLKNFRENKLNKDELVLFSRLCFWYVENLMDRNEKNESLLMDISKNGMDVGSKCMEEYPKEAGCYYFKAVNKSRYESIRGISTSSISLLPKLEKLMDKVDELSPGYDCDGTDRFWGRVIYEVPWLVRKVAGYSLEESNNYYKKSIKQFPNLFMTRVYLAELLIKEKKYKEALAQINYVLSHPTDGCGEDHIPENIRWQRNARLLKLKYWDLLAP